MLGLVAREMRRIVREGPYMAATAADLIALSRYAPLVRLNAICPYYTMFPLDFPLRVLADASPEDWVFDPFCGRGTTLYAARLMGLSTVGIDANPVAAALAESKLATASPVAVIRRCKHLLTTNYEPQEVPTGDFWRRCFSPSTLRDICALREQLRDSNSTPITVLLRALVLGVLHGPLRVNEPTYLSNQMPRTYAAKPKSAVRFWESKELEAPAVDVSDVVGRRARFTLAQLPPAVCGDVRCGDSAVETSGVRRRFSWVITSPPYYGMRTYLPDQWLRAWFLGADPVVDYGAEGQLPQSSEEVFVEGLARVWRAAAGKCLPGARLVIRFGALPSKDKDPAGLLSQSVRASRAGWVVDQIVAAGVPPRGRRQADQMNNGAGDYVEEVDLYATLHC